VHPEPARRIILAARQIIGRRGFEEARITDIARAADVARGAIFYYFGTKERLVVEALRADADERLAALREHLGATASLDEVVRCLSGELARFLDAERASYVLFQQIEGAAITREEIRAAQQRIRVGWRQAFADILREKERTGVIGLRGEPEVVAAVLMSLGHGIANEILTDPDWDPAPAIALAEQAARWLLAPDGATGHA
jgi:AcrR family transcriptional regulator